MDLSVLLTKGYFPKELPHPFTAASFGSIITVSGTSLPSEFSNDRAAALPVVHNLARAGSLRRKLSIPNPINFYRLSSFVAANWSNLVIMSRQSPISLTSPSDTSEPRAINPRSPLKNTPLERARIRASSRFILQADISRFYPSIYTHSIPWAIHSKATAKANRSLSLIGNVLDLHVRNAQDRQTMGIPIGPDTSLLIAEILLGAVDKQVLSNVQPVGFRHIDDYEFGFQTYSEAEKTLGIIQEILADYELDLNPTKTKIIELPVPIESSSISELRSFRFRSSDVAQQVDIIRYIDRAFALATENPDEGVLKYAISRLNGTKIITNNWSLCEDLLMQCCLIEPGTIQFVLNQLVRYHNADYQLTLTKIGDCMNQLIVQHAPLGHGSEVAWALWTLIVFGISVDGKAIEVISSMEDSIVAVLALDARNKGLIPSSHTFDHYQTYLTTDALYGDQWLLSYEANFKGWLVATDGTDHVSQDPCFAYLKNTGVSFYDESIDIANIPTRPFPETEDQAITDLSP